MFKLEASRAYEAEQERLKFAAIAATKREAEEKATAAQALCESFQAWLDANHAGHVGFEVIGERLVLTDDGALLFLRLDSKRLTWRGDEPDPFVLVYGLCPACRKLTSANEKCRSMADVGRVLGKFPGDSVHWCGAVSEAGNLITSASHLIYSEEDKDRVFRAFYGMTRKEMERGFLFTRIGPVPLLHPNAPSRMEDPLARFGLTAADVRELLAKAPGEQPGADSPFAGRGGPLTPAPTELVSPGADCPTLSTGAGESSRLSPADSSEG